MKHSDATIRKLCAQLDLDRDFVVQCLTESVAEVEEVNARLEFKDATLLRLRRVQRICLTFEVELSVALLLVNIHDHAADLRSQLVSLKHNPLP